MSGDDGRCQLTEGCPHEADQVVVTVNGYVIDACQLCAVAACDLLATMPQDDLSAFMRGQSANPEYREALWYLPMPSSNSRCSSNG